jgi:hypothetical protein
MKTCVHYDLNEKENRYYSLVKQIRKHVFECKRCKVKLHDVDNQNLDNWIKYLNNASTDKTGLLEQKADIYYQLKPIPREY